jgi:hypothetical protein
MGKQKEQREMPKREKKKNKKKKRWEGKPRHPRMGISDFLAQG